MKRYKGISLIVLVITIIVIIILAGSVILSLANNNPIKQANEATFKADIDAYNSELNMYLSNIYVQNPSFIPSSLNAGIWNGDTNNINNTIKKYIPSITTDDAKKFEIQNGKLVYVGDSTTEMSWSKDVNIALGYVTNGLVYYVDASDSYSYPTSGTKVYNLSGTDKTSNINNAVSFVSNGNSSYFTNFTGSNYILSETTAYSSPSIPTGSSPRTIIAGIRTPSSVANEYQHIVHYGEAASDKAYGLALNYGYLSNHTWNGNSRFSNYPLQANTNYIVAVKYNDTSSPRNTYFVNGVFGTTGYGQARTVDYSINTGNAVNINIGQRIVPGENFGADGKIYFIQIYNRDLTNDEILKNYNVFRTRFGI